MKSEWIPQAGDTVYLRDGGSFRGYFSGEVVREVQADEGFRLGVKDGAGNTVFVPAGGCEILALDGSEAGEVFTRLWLPGRAGEELYPSEEAVEAVIEAELAKLRHISASRYLDPEILAQYLYTMGGFLAHDPVSRTRDAEERLLILLQNQFGMLEPRAMFDALGEKSCADFLNGAMALSVQRERGDWERGERGPISAETLRKFLAFASEDVLPPFPEPMTLRRFLRMCRVAYDAADGAQPQPPGASDLFVCCANRSRTYREDFSFFCEGCEAAWDSPDVFRELYRPSDAIPYHIEELRFGGPSILLSETRSGKWSGFFYYRGYNEETAADAIEMYVALREAGYPLPCGGAGELLRTARSMP